ncbi:MAG: SpoIIE family protein phosphatase [Candidatus Sulfotelmatobacter sp.]
MTRLRKMMLEELERRNYAQTTIDCYIQAIEDFARHFHRPPDQLTAEHIREYQAYLFRERKLAASTVTQRLAALRFFYTQTIKKAWGVADTPYPKKTRPTTAQHLEPGRSSPPHRLVPDSVSSHGIDDTLWHWGTAVLQSRPLGGTLARIPHGSGSDGTVDCDGWTARVGFVLADVSGKGVHAALLMANLQACLRSQSGIMPLDPARLLQQVNRMLWKATDSEHFATLFFAIYDDSTRQMVYVNCGHNPPVWLRQDGSVQRLASTATVIGLFEQWECSVEQIRLDSEDLLVIFSDGVTEAPRNEEEYGEARLIHELQACRHLQANEIVQAILASVQKFSAGTQSDDLTLLIAKARV